MNFMNDDREGLDAYLKHLDSGLKLAVNSQKAYSRDLEDFFLYIEEYGIALQDFSLHDARDYVRKLKDELFRRGVDRSLWEEALEEVEDPAEQIDKLIAKKMRGEDPKDRKALKRTADALARRGYGWEDIREGLLRYGAEDDT